MGNKLGGLPTVKLAREELARYAREADESARQAESAGQRATSRPGPSPDAGSDAEIEISVEVEDLASLEIDSLLRGDADALGAGDDGPYVADHSSEVRLARATAEPDAEELAQLASVPWVIACREDLSWFELEETSNLVLAMIDGESTVEAIVTAVGLPRASVLAILSELAAHGVIELR